MRILWRSVARNCVSPRLRFIARMRDWRVESRSPGPLVESTQVPWKAGPLVESTRDQRWIDLKMQVLFRDEVPDDLDPIYSTEDFLVYCYKVLPCTLRFCHGELGRVSQSSLPSPHMGCLDGECLLDACSLSFKIVTSLAS